MCVEKTARVPLTLIPVRRLIFFALASTLACGDDPAGVRDLEPSVTRVIPSLDAEVSVLRVENDVPHIYAKNILDLHRAQGFVMAQDRYVQMELTRRFGAGTLSEVLGDLGVEIDATARGQGMRFVADRIWEEAPEGLRARFEAFAEGVNAYSAAVKRGQLPVPEEIEIVAGLSSLSDPADAMKPMTGYDIAAVAAVLMSRLGYESTDLVRAAMAKRLADLPDGPVKRGLIDDTFLATAPVHRYAQARPGEPGQALTPEHDLVRTPPLSVEPAMLARTVGRTGAFAKLVGKTGEEFGSNAWAVSSRGTGDRGAILANDGHLSLTVPSLFYQMCLDGAYFGEDEYAICGLFFPGFPLLAVGTNGHVAWGQTYLDGDVVDFYREEIVLRPDGLPAESRFMGQARPLQRVDETYRAGEDEVTIPRWTTFDGRFLISVEGEVTEADDERPLFFALGDWIAPSDVNGDGTIEAISFDWTAFDMGRTIEAVDGFARARTIGDFKEETKKLVGYAQNVIVADEQGDIMYTAYHALPCRRALVEESAWVAGGNPQQLLDGTRFGGFTVQEDCDVPFEVGPRAENPSAGYVLTANHDPLGNGFDDSLANDEWYIGGPWSLAYRASTIEAALADVVAGEAATIESMARIQSDHTSPLGRQYGPILLEALTDQRFEEARARLSTWLDRGAQAKSGVDTFYASFTPEEKEDAVATMIFNAWLRRFAELLFDEEGADEALLADRSRSTFRTLSRLMESRGENRAGLASFDDARGESVLFDLVATASVTETSDQLITMAMDQILAELASAGHFGTTDMDAWLWGLEHQVKLVPLLEEVGADNPLVGLIAFKFGLTTEQLPLAPDLDASDPRASLEHFPRNGDWFGVDAANPGLTRGPYTHTHGPVMRMVIQLDDGEVRGQNILPGGQSGLIGDEHFADQAALWLGNRTIPLRFSPDEAVEGATSRELFTPRRE